ncbi:MAG TPA: 1-acyl-sn-glycerol-3-phosphate acyltransferase, partial [Allosphingosinicella sp.]|nr:1-acyl-sn-glycerol-3-phosphate acyltransferase [Allosphingosinicella sp.]
IAVDYGAAGAEIAWTGDEPAFANVRRILSRRGTLRVVLHFLTPIDPAATAGRKALSDAARNEILAALQPSEAGADRL